MGELRFKPTNKETDVCLVNNILFMNNDTLEDFDLQFEFETLI